MLSGKRVLFFDDAWDRRCVKFLKFVPHAQIVRTIDQAIRNLWIGHWDLVFLDYDLEEAESPINRKGDEVAKFMVENHAKLSIGRVVVHSTSEVGRTRFRETLRPLYITRSIPFEQELMPMLEKTGFMSGA